MLSRGGESEAAVKSFGTHMKGRAFCIIDGFSIGMGAAEMMKTDLVVMPLGCRTPVVLRKAEDYEEVRSGPWTVVGDIYVHGWMTGHAVEEMRNGMRLKERFLLV